MSWSRWSFSLRPTPNLLHFLAFTLKSSEDNEQRQTPYWSFLFPRKFLCMLWWILHTYNFSPLIIVLLFGRFYVIICGEIFEKLVQFSSVQFSHSVVSNALQPHESQHTRPPCPSPTPRVHSDSRPSSQWCHPAISFLCCPLLLLSPIPPSIRVFSNESTLSMRWPKYWSFSFSIIPSKEIPGLIPGWISLQSKGLSRVFSNTTVKKHQYFGAQLSSQSNSHIHTWPQEKP